MFVSKYKYEIKDYVKGRVFTAMRQNRVINIVGFSLVTLALILNMIPISLSVFCSERGVYIVGAVLMLVCLIVMASRPFVYKLRAEQDFDRELKDIDMCVVTIEDAICEEVYIVGDKRKKRTVYNLKKLTACREDDERFILTFNDKFVLVRKDSLEGDIDTHRSTIKQYYKIQDKRKISR